MTDFTEISDLLKGLDLPDGEIKLYMIVLKHGKIASSKCVSLLSVNRFTFVLIAGKLVQKKLIKIVKIGRNKFLKPIYPESLEFALGEKNRTLNHFKDDFFDISNFLNKKIADNYSFNNNTEIFFYSDKKSVKKLYGDFCKYDGDVFSIELGGNEKFRLFDESFYKRLSKGSKNKNNNKMKEIVYDNEYSRTLRRNMIGRYESRFLPNNLDISDINLYLFDGNILSLQFTKDSFSCFLIKSELLYSSFVSIYNAIWDILPKDGDSANNIDSGNILNNILNDFEINLQKK